MTWKKNSPRITRSESSPRALYVNLPISLSPRGNHPSADQDDKWAWFWNAPMRSERVTYVNVRYFISTDSPFLIYDEHIDTNLQQQS